MPRVYRTGKAPVRYRKNVHCQGEDRRVHRPLRHQPSYGRGYPHLSGGLRTDGLRYRYRHGRTLRRPERLRVRQEVRSAHRACRRPPQRRHRHQQSGEGVHRGRHRHQLRQIQWHGQPRSHQGHAEGLRGSRLRRSQGQLQAARLADLPPALLGHAHPHDLLRRLRLAA